ncbi:MAG: selenocysteine-specific translation elongation factor [Candidatus Cloacimonetes bacterium]|nr:selenocysteine-specific translation elongation factor [Candidatus Cloacimonadota bacterium]
MKHLIMGTAGHIDHGKTTLIKQLTGYDCDTHKEEKERGITIYLGFSHYTLSNGNTIGIVDVPGHSDFINTMIAGASGIDFVLLVIAADAGIMPQTLEHLRIMGMLGIKKGMIVITKTDLVEHEYLQLITEDVAELVKGTFLEKSPIINFSAVTGEGLPEIIAALEGIESEILPRPNDEVFRLYIDRVFNITGFGTVVTGTVQSGHINKDSKLYLLPKAEKVRIRRLERYGKEVSELTAGDRGSINLAGIDRSKITRGMLVTDRVLQDTKLVDVKLSLFPEGGELPLWSQCIFLHGTEQFEVRVHLLDTDKLQSGNESIAQIHFKNSLYACYGDRFVIRNSSADKTIGGGEIIDVKPLHHRRRTAKLLSNLQRILLGNLEELIAAEVRKNVNPLSIEYLAGTFNKPVSELLKIVDSSLPEDIVVVSSQDELFLQEQKRYIKTRNKIINNLTTYHKNNPLEETGRSFDELMGLYGKDRDEGLEKYIEIVLADLVSQKQLKKVDNTWTLYTHNVKFSEELANQVYFVENYLLDSGMKTPLMSELLPAAEKKGIDEKLLYQILKLLVYRKKAYRIEDNYIHSDIVDKCRIKLLESLLNKKEGITVAEYRDIISGNRKICLLLLARFDGEGITIRKGDYRIITEKGRKLLFS